MEVKLGQSSEKFSEKLILLVGVISGDGFDLLTFVAKGNLYIGGVEAFPHHVPQ